MQLGAEHSALQTAGNRCAQPGWFESIGRVGVPSAQNSKYVTRDHPKAGYQYLYLQGAGGAAAAHIRGNSMRPRR